MNPVTTRQNNTSHIDPLLNKPGLTYGRTVINLTDQIKDSRDRDQMIIISVAVVVGVALTVATLAGAIFLLATIQYNPEKNEHGFSEMLPGEGWKLGVGLSFFNLTAAIPGIIVGGMVYLIGWGISELTLWCAARTHKAFSETFEDDALIENDDLAIALSKCNETRQKTMISEMNFEQLAVAEKTLGSKQFGEMIEDLDKEQFQLWRHILEISSEVSDDEVLTKLSGAIPRLIQTRPLFAEQLRKKLKDRKDSKIVALLKPSPFSPSSETSESSTLTFKCEGKEPILADRQLLEERSGKLINLFEDETSVNITAEQYPLISLMIDACTNEDFVWNLDHSIQLFDLAVEMKSKDILNFIENTLINHRTSLNKEDLLTKYCPHFPTLKSLMEKDECKIKVNDDNWLEIKEKAEKHNLTHLLNKCRAFVFQRAQDTLAEDWLERCLELEFLCKTTISDIKLYLAGNITHDNFVKIYTFAHKEREKKEYANGDEDLHKACFKFVNEHGCKFVKDSFKDPFSKEVLSKLSEWESKEFSKTLEDKIDLNSLKYILRFAEEKNNEILRAKCLDFVEANKSEILNKNIWKNVKSHPQCVVDILYPKQVLADPWTMYR